MGDIGGKGRGKGRLGRGERPQEPEGQGGGEHRSGGGMGTEKGGQEAIWGVETRMTVATKTMTEQAHRGRVQTRH